MLDINEELKGIFIEEAGDILQSLNELFKLWQNALEDSTKVVALQRELHTLKGGARMLHIDAIAQLAHELESLYQAVSRQSIKADSGVCLLADDCHHRLIAQVEALKNGSPLPASQDLLDRLVVLLNPNAPSLATPQPPQAPVPSPEPTHPSVSPNSSESPSKTDTDDKKKVDLVRVKARSLENLNHLLNENSINLTQIDAGVSLLGDHLTELEQTTQRLNEQFKKLAFATSALFTSRHVSQKVAIGFDRLEMDDYSEAQQLTLALGETTSDLFNINKHLFELKLQAERALVGQSRIASELVANIVETRLVSFSQVSNRLINLCHTTATDLGKKVSFELVGAEIELDRMILDKVVPCLEHLVRNAIDHGIENPDMRTQSGKPMEGHIRVHLTSVGQEIVIELIDDGMGINLEAVKAKALRLGILKAEQNYSTEEILHCIFQPGFTTKDQVTAISGRGIGMDVVHSEIKKIGGTTQIVSETGQGTRIFLKIPMTLSLYRALFFTNFGQSYGISVTFVAGITRMPVNNIKLFLQVKPPRYEYNGEFYRLIYLNELIGDEPQAELPKKKHFPVVLLKTFPTGIGLVVDSLIGSQEIVIKALSPQFSYLESLAGATVASDGQVKLILDAPALAIKAKIILARRALSPNIKAETKPIAMMTRTASLKVLIIDDSITVRKVTSNLLERHGCQVMTAKDGIEGLERLAEQRPDIILLDVEMPRMDGFEFAASLQADPLMNTIPIVMITSRTGAKHSERALKLGVRTMMSKPYQDQDLLNLISEYTGIIL